MEHPSKLEHPVSLRWLILFALPTIASSIFANLYSTVDGVFVARWVHTDALSAINITMPMIYVASALGMMFGSGGNALVAKKIGQGRQKEAREDFSLLMAVAFGFSVVLAVLGWGLSGAAIATGIGYAVPSAAGTIWFFTHRIRRCTSCGPNGTGRRWGTAAPTARPRWWARWPSA